ncbi:MAG: AAA family ATPase [Wenzhouxiangellaceae bacterium]|nr:AAA family ATPase [Wenzhouxiangellaceae bacterium]
MILERLQITALPGLSDALKLDRLGAGMHFIIGPNASGKSSLVRALRYLLAGYRTGDPAGLWLEADFRLGERHLSVTRHGRETRWSEFGDPVPPPALPPPDLLHCYLLGIEDLVDAGGDRDRSIAQRIKRELSGGIDFDALRDGEFARQPRVGLQERAALDAARQQREAIEADYRALADEEARLPELDRQVEQAAALRRRQSALESALEWHETAARKQSLELEQAALPDCLSRLRGHELEQLEQLEGERDRLAGEAATIEQQGRRAERDLEQSGLAAAVPDPGELVACARRLDRLQRLTDEQRQADRVRAEQSARRAELVAALGAGECDTPPVTPARLDEVERWAGRWRALQLKRENVQARLDSDEEQPSVEDLDAAVKQHDRALQAVDNWLQRGPGPMLPWALAVLLLALAALVYAPHTNLAGHLPSMDGLGGGRLAALLGVAGLLLGGLAWRLHAPPRRRLEHDLRELEITPGRNRHALATTRGRLAERLAALNMAREQARRAEHRREELAALDGEAQVLADERAALARVCGFDPEYAASAIEWFARRLGELAALDHDRAAARAAQTSRAHDIEELEQGLIRTLVRYCPALKETPDVEALSAQLEQLQQRARQAEAARATLADLAAREPERQRRQHEVRARIDALYQDAGLDPGDQHALERALKALPDWQQRGDEIRSLELTLQRLHARLERDVNDLLEQLRDGGEVLLREQLDTVNAKLESIDSAQTERAGIIARLQQAGRDGRLNAAARDEQRARDALEQSRQRQLEAELADLLTTDIEREYRSREAPVVLGRAREAFARYTRGAWALDIDTEGHFRALDCASERHRALAELSTGTRMQLLLAARMAWAARHEAEGVALPLWLDEALTTSDPERFAAVAAGLADLVRDGRQVFYLSAGTQEYQFWQQLALPPARRIDLATAVETPAPVTLELDAQPVLPVPGDSTPAAYAHRLGVAAPDPDQPAAALHPFYLLPDDLEHLHELISRWHITHLGALDALLDSPLAARAIGDATQRARLAARVRAARTWFEAVRIGRGRPVTSATLERALDNDGGLSENTLPGVTALLTDNGSDAQALLERLEQEPIAMQSGNRQRLGRRQREKFAAFLQESGHLDPRAPLAAEARWRYLLEHTGLEPDEVCPVYRALEAGLDAMR